MGRRPAERVNTGGEICEVRIKVGKTGGINEQVGETGRANELGESGLQENELGEEEELVHNGVDGAVALMEQEAGWSPAPLRLHNDEPGSVGVKPRSQTGRQTGRRAEVSDQ